jgi:hypothetical protein
MASPHYINHSSEETFSTISSISKAFAFFLSLITSGRYNLIKTKRLERIIHLQPNTDSPLVIIGGRNTFDISMASHVPNRVSRNTSTSLDNPSSVPLPLLLHKESEYTHIQTVPRQRVDITINYTVYTYYSAGLEYSFGYVAFYSNECRKYPLIPPSQKSGGACRARLRNSSGESWKRRSSNSEIWRGKDHGGTSHAMGTV